MMRMMETRCIPLRFSSSIRLNLYPTLADSSFPLSPLQFSRYQRPSHRSIFRFKVRPQRAPSTNGATRQTWGILFEMRLKLQNSIFKSWFNQAKRMMPRILRVQLHQRIARERLNRPWSYLLRFLRSNLGRDTFVSDCILLISSWKEWKSWRGNATGKLTREQEEWLLGDLECWCYIGVLSQG